MRTCVRAEASVRPPPSSAPSEIRPIFGAAQECLDLPFRGLRLCPRGRRDLLRYLDNNVNLRYRLTVAHDAAGMAYEWR